MNAQAIPIFVIGINRTGTKWLSNLLANHPDVVAVQEERHSGILETNVFDVWTQRFPDLSRPDEYVAFIELWSRTDFFQATGVDPSIFYELETRPENHLELFGILMDRFAELQGADRWLQKLDPWSAAAALAHFPNATPVVIERDRDQTLRSNYYPVSGTPEPISLRTLARHQLQERILRQLREEGAMAARYEGLRADPESELRRVCEGLGLSFPPSILDLPWRKNTSFRTPEAERFQFSAAERRKIRASGWLVDAMPERALRFARRWFRNGSPIVNGTFSRIKRAHGIR